MHNAGLQARHSQERRQLFDLEHATHSLAEVNQARLDLRKALALLFSASSPQVGFSQFAPGDNIPAITYSRCKGSNQCVPVMYVSKRKSRRQRAVRRAIRAQQAADPAESKKTKKSWKDLEQWDLPVSLHSDDINPPRYLCVLDFEATCDDFEGYAHEIIEFPVVLVDLENSSFVGEFHSYVRPTVNKTLTKFCTDLTGINQTQVDLAPTLPEVLEMFEEWRISKGLEHNEEGQNFIFVTHGPWDLKEFLSKECKLKGIHQADYFKEWSNIKKIFKHHYFRKNLHPRLTISDMLSRAGMKFEGRQHSGIDDTRNIARIALRMHQQGARFRRNERLPKPRVPVSILTTEPELVPA